MKIVPGELLTFSGDDLDAVRIPVWLTLNYTEEFPLFVHPTGQNLMLAIATCRFMSVNYVFVLPYCGWVSEYRLEKQQCRQ